MILPGVQALRSAADTDLSDIAPGATFVSAEWDSEGSNIEITFNRELTLEEERAVRRRLITEGPQRENEVLAMEGLVEALEQSLAAGTPLAAHPFAEEALLRALRAAYPELPPTST